MRAREDYASLGLVTMRRSRKHSRQGERCLGLSWDSDAVKTVFDNLEAGMSVAEITEVFDVTPEEVTAVVRFVSESLEKEPSYA